MEVKSDDELTAGIHNKFIPEALEEIRSGRLERPVKSWVHSLLRPALGEGPAVDMDRLRQEVQKALKFTGFAKPLPFDEARTRKEAYKEITILAAVKRISGDNLEKFLALTFQMTYGKMTYEDALGFVREIESGGEASLMIGAADPYVVRKAIFRRLPKSLRPTKGKSRRR